MENDFFSFEPVDSGGYRYQDVYRSRKEGKQARLFELDDRGGLSPQHSGVFPLQTSHESPKLESILDQLYNISEEEKPVQRSLASLKLLSNYTSSGLRRSNEEILIEQQSGKRLSAEEVVRVAGARYIQLFIETDDDLSMLGHPFGCALLGLSNDEIKDVELVHFLLAAADKVGNKQFERAGKLLSQCYHLGSDTGNPVQRVVFYFAEALQERINRETGRGSNQEYDIEEAMMSLNPAILGYYQRLPFSQVLQVIGTQVIFDNIGLAKRVHLIDLGIRTGMQWITLMHALASRSESRVELFTISAVGTTSQHKIEETGRRLSDFAQTINLPFSFKLVMVSHLNDLKEDLFELEVGEAVAVFSPMVLRTMIAQPDHLVNLMKVINNIKPCIMVVTEIEANHNSPIFVNRFLETLFFYSAFFDCFDACTDSHDKNRMMAERIFTSQTIRNIVATEGHERTMRHVGIEVWRAFFLQFQMVETELSESALYQARLVVDKFANAHSCTLHMNGKSLTIGWRGTPFHSLSAWKFVHSETVGNEPIKNL